MWEAKEEVANEGQGWDGERVEKEEKGRYRDDRN